MKTRVTDMLGIQYPIFAGGLQWLSRAEFAAAISNAGAMGVINARTQPTPEALIEEIKKTQSLTSKPFAVNISMLPDTNEDNATRQYVEAAIKGGAKVVETSGRSPEEFMPMLKEAGIKVIHKVPSVRFAKKAESIGVDMVEIIGFECGGHPGMDDVATSVLIMKAAQELSIPIIAGGGYATGQGLVAALAMGAEGVDIGSRFVASTECTIHQNFKDWIVRSQETDTMVIQYSIRNPLRCMKSDSAKKVKELEAAGAAFEEIYPLISGKNQRSCYESGDIQGAPFPIGQAVGLIKDIKPIAEIIDEIMREAALTMTRLTNM